VEPSLVIAVTKEKNNMTMPAGIQKKTKDNSNKKYREHDEWMQGKKLGRPKQRWVGSTLNGEPFLPSNTEEIEVAITEESINDGSYIPAHWEKVVSA
jgi:hypothetical protein